MKKLLLSAIMAMSTLAMSAGYNLLTVYLDDNSLLDIVIKEELELSFTDTDFMVRGGVNDVTLKKEQIVSFIHSYDPAAAIAKIEAEGGFSFDGDALVFSGLKDGSDVRVYNTAGICVATYKVNGNCKVSLSELASGVYIVNADGKSIKISKR